MYGTLFNFLIYGQGGNEAALGKITKQPKRYGNTKGKRTGIAIKVVPGGTTFINKTTSGNRGGLLRSSKALSDLGDLHYPQAHNFSQDCGLRRVVGLFWDVGVWW